MDSDSDSDFRLGFGQGGKMRSGSRGKGGKGHGMHRGSTLGRVALRVREGEKRRWGVKHDGVGMMVLSIMCICTYAPEAAASERSTPIQMDG